jgi:hypothetical protein
LEFWISNLDDLVKNQNLDGKEKSSRCKARKSSRVRRTWQYAATTKDAAQRRRWTFYEAINLYRLSRIREDGE